MNSFQFKVIGTALLVAMITYIVMIANTDKTASTHPPIATDCPDYWRVKAPGVCYIPEKGGRNLGNLVGHDVYKYANGSGEPKYTMLSQYYSTTNEKTYTGTLHTVNGKPVQGYFTSDIPSGYDTQSPQKNWIDFNDAGWSQNGGAMCEHRRWARIHNIAWDGLNNSTAC